MEEMMQPDSFVLPGLGPQELEAGVQHPLTGSH